MSAILLRTESSSSSQIENLTTSARQLALAEIGQSDKANALTVVGNVRAMEAALALSDNLEVEAILTMHRELMRHQPGFEHHAGRFREEVVWIGRDNAGPIGADFVAPHKGLANHVTVPISAGLLTDTGTYFTALTAFRGGDAGPIVHRFADASRFAAASGRALVDDVTAQRSSIF